MIPARHLCPVTVPTSRRLEHVLEHMLRVAVRFGAGLLVGHYLVEGSCWVADHVMAPLAAVAKR